jgi:hypothetical protein
VALAASVVAALLHVAALGVGPLVLVQPLGVSTLVFALLIGARTGATPITRRSGLGAGGVVVGLPLVLSIVPHHPHTAAALLHYRWAAAALLAVVVAAVAFGQLFRSRAQLAAVCYAVGAATCFGLTSGTVRAVWLGHATPPAVMIGLTAAVVGIALAQHAYRDGGLGAPLATLTLVDPLSAGALGVLLLGETLNLTPTHLTLAAAGAGATVLGVVLLSRPQPSAPTTPPLPQDRTTARPPAPARAASIDPRTLRAETVIDQSDR